jgi:phosphatidylinositol glycan class W
LQTKYQLFEIYGPLQFAVDFLLNIGAVLLATTLYASNPILLQILFLAPAILLNVSKGSSRRKRGVHPVPKNDASSIKALDPLPLKPFLTTYRGCMMVITCLCILAVDFRIFPRRFAKVENWGTSLMDLGVGSFVFSAGVVAARPILKEKITGSYTTLGSRLYTSMRHSTPLLVLGFIRLWSVKGLDYAEHITEYGVHWNFFFTLGFLPPFVAIFQWAFQIIPSFEALALLLAGAYQIALEFTDLKAFILTAPRTNLFSQNREGIFSFIGYLAIFLAGQGTGTYSIPRNILPNAPTGSFAQRKKLLLTLATTSLIWCLLYVVATEYYGLGLTVSRRLANLPYVIFVAAFNCLQITAFCAIETVFFPEVYKATDKEVEKRNSYYATSRILWAYNRNGLAIFLLANLLTGLVNLTIPTLHVGDATATAIMLAYAAVTTGVAVLLDMYDISIKM